MVRRISGCLALAVLFALSSLSTSAQKTKKPAGPPPTTGTITGTVNDNHGSPLSGARVMLLSEETKETTNASTDGSGSYRFDNLKPGTYDLAFQSKGFLDKEDRVKVKVGKNSNVSLRMKLPPSAPKPQTE